MQFLWESVINWQPSDDCTTTDHSHRIYKTKDNSCYNNILILKYIINQ